jgi:hypothetical protein
MCQTDLNLLPSREIIDFDADDLFLVGELIDREGDVWLEMKERVAARSVRRLLNS